MTQLITALILITGELPVELEPSGEGFEPFLLIMLVVTAVAVVALAAIGVVMGLVATITGGALAFSGAAITSAIIAATRRNPSLGFTLFVAQITAVARAVLGAGVGLAYSYLHELPLLNLRYTGSTTLAGLLVAGMLGWGTARLWLSVWDQLTAWWRERSARRLG